MSLTVSVENLRKSFVVSRSPGAFMRAPFRRERKVALDGCSLTICRGEKVALIGPNGAGKTTLARVLCGTVTGDGGTAAIDSIDVGTMAARSLVALARPDDPALHPRLTVREALRFHASLHGALKAMGGGDFVQAVEALGLGALMARRVVTLSAGEKARASLVKALLPRPSLLILDEMSRVLDPGALVSVRHLIDARCARGMAALEITHDLEEARRATRLLVMARGRVVAAGGWDEVRQTVAEVFELPALALPVSTRPDGGEV